MVRLLGISQKGLFSNPGSAMKLIGDLELISQFLSNLHQGTVEKVRKK